MPAYSYEPVGGHAEMPSLRILQDDLKNDRAKDTFMLTGP